jgi:hypothetical protein
MTAPSNFPDEMSGAKEAKAGRPGVKIPHLIRLQYVTTKKEFDTQSVLPLSQGSTG